MLKKIISNLLNIIFPKSCVQCGKFGNYICEICFKDILITPIKIINRSHSSYSKLYACTSYHNMPILKILIKKFKYNSLKENGDILATLMLKRLRMLSDSKRDFDIIMSVPMHRKRKLQRTFNHAQLLAKIISKQINLPYLNCLKKIINTPQQAKLNFKERYLNVLNSFAVPKNCLQQVVDKKILLIDDVSTTGATIQECSKMLIQNGAKSVIALVLAKTNL